MRLCIVPLALAVGFAADDDVLRDMPFLAICAVAQIYAVTVYVLLRRGRHPTRSVVLALDALAVVLLAIAADPHSSASGRIPLLVLLVGWGLIADPRTTLLRGGAVTVVVVAAELVRHGATEPPARTAVFLVVVLAICVGLSRRMADRADRIRALERRVAEVGFEARELQRRERERLAQLLHDDALQRVLAARQDLEQGLDGDRESLRVAADGLAEATRALRGLTLVAHDEALEVAGLDAAVRRIVEETARRAALSAHVVVDPGLDPECAPVVLGLLRELVTNVERHAEARQLVVEVRRDSVGFSVVVQDDGRGMTPLRLVEAERQGHLGHASLRRRVQELHGTLEVDTTPGAGCRVAVHLRSDAVREQRALEDALRNEREWNATLVAGFPDPFVVLTPDLRLVDVSDRFVALTGWPRVDLLAAPAGELPYWPPARRPELRRMSAVPGDAHEHEVEIEIVCRDGRRLDVIASASVVRDPRGERDLQLVTFKDISARKQIERGLSAERDLSSALREVLREPYVRTARGVVVDVNDAFCELVGHPRDALLAMRRPYPFLAPETRDRALEYAAEIDAHGSAEVQIVLLRADGSCVLVDVVGVAVRDESGETVGRVQTVRPVREVEVSLVAPSVPGGLVGRSSRGDAA